MNKDMQLSLVQQENLILKFRRDIIAFVETCIINPYNEKTGSNFFITNQQRTGLKKICQLVNEKVNGKSQDILGISIMSGKGTGKDAFAAWVIEWFNFCFPYPKIPCVSVSADQLNKVLWSELAKWWKHSAIYEYFILQNDKFFRKDVKDEIRGKEWFAFTKAANPKSTPDEQVETLAGQHADYLLQVVDEGSGVLNPVYETLEKNMTGLCNLMLLIFNPMHAKGYAVETQYKNRKRWITLRWNAEESEIVNQANVKRIEDDYGRESNTYRMNILGLPPLFDEQTTFNWEKVLDAVNRPLTILPGTPLVYAVDCGAGGDKSIIASRRGNKINPFKRNSTTDSVELVNWLGTNIDIDDPDTARIDTIGIGWAVEGELRNKKGSIVEAIDSRRQADNNEMFVNKRAEMYWNLRDLIERGTISIPDDPELLNQMAAMKHEINNRGQIVMMDKRKVRKELGRSPDELDAMAMLYYYPDTYVSKNRTHHHIIEIIRRGKTWMRG